jgi:hypothetical protein
MESLETLRAREEEVAREWQWLHDALNLVARVRAEQGAPPRSALCGSRPGARRAPGTDGAAGKAHTLTWTAPLRTYPGCPPSLPRRRSLLCA